MNKKRQKRINRLGISLLEILLSLFVLATSLSVIFSGFEVSKKISSQATFESEAAFLAERELELAKAELLNGNLKAKKARQLKSRFQLKPGWNLSTILTPPDNYNTVKLQVKVTQADKELQLESFLFLPPKEVSHES